jgi:large subunit ribosomal protein L36e
MAEAGDKKPRYIIPSKNLVKNVIHEIAGFSPYEKRAIDLKKLGKDKLTRNFLKKRLGTYKRAVRKATELEDVVHRVEGADHH